MTRFKAAEMFRQYPLSDTDIMQLVERTGYQRGTILNAMRGNVPMNMDVFDMVVNDYITPRYPDADPDLIMAAREETTLYRKRRLVKAPSTSAPAPAPGPVDLFATLLALTKAAAPSLTMPQRLNLIRHLTHEGD